MPSFSSSFLFKYFPARVCLGVSGSTSWSECMCVPVPVSCVCLCLCLDLLSRLKLRTLHLCDPCLSVPCLSSVSFRFRQFFPFVCSSSCRLSAPHGVVSFYLLLSALILIVIPCVFACLLSRSSLFILGYGSRAPVDCLLPFFSFGMRLANLLFTPTAHYWSPTVRLRRKGI